MLTLKEIEKARKAIAGSIYLSPLAYSETLSNQTGYKVHLKLENLQMTGSFKERGALNRILNLYEEEKSTGVIAASAGNHAQGVANAVLTLETRGRDHVQEIIQALSKGGYPVKELTQG